MSWPYPRKLVNVTDHQRLAYHNATKSPIGILGGSPGCGKTWVIASLVELIGQQFGYQHVIIGTPTGKAAVRVTENLSLRGIPVRARTWHSLLNSIDSEGMQHFPVKFIIGDETSMNDTDLMARILRARSVGSHVLFVGDINQLPPVGHGAPLRDMIAAGVAYGELREIKRNSGGIVEACAAIRDNVQWTPGDNLILDHQNKAENQIASLLRWLDEAKKQGIDPVWECQPVVAVNEKSPLSRKELNKILQQRLNTQPGMEGIPFRLKDKLVNTENGYFPLVESKSTDGDVVKNQKGEVYVANGELAKVIHLDGKVVFVELQSPHRVVSFNLGRVSQKKEIENDDKAESNNGCTFDLGYALSVHKCVHPDTIVETDEGLLPIRLIAGKGTIGTPSGSNSYCNRVYFDNRDCLKLKTQHGHEITVTLDHKCEVWNGSSFELREASFLEEGQWVRQKIGVSVDPENVPFLPGADCKVPHKVTEDFAEFCGLMVADGTVFARGFRLGKGNEEVVLRFGELCKKLFECETVFWHTPGKKTGIYFCEVRSSALSKWLMRIGGMSPNSKATPECILRSSSTIHASFLRGLFEDGSVHIKAGKLDHVNWTTIFPELRKQVQVMLLRLGIISSVNSQRKHADSVYIYSTFAKLFEEKVGLISNHKKERLALPIGSTNGESQRFQIPVDIDFCAEHRDQIVAATTRSVYENLRTRKTISRLMAKKIADLVPEFGDMLNWHYSKIQSIEKTTGPAMCVEVPGEHKFLQNGFPWGNSQGSDWPWVLPLLDDYPGATRVCDRSWLYTAISRAKSKCILIGTKHRADSMCKVSSISKRKTFLREQILMLQSIEELAGV